MADVAELAIKITAAIGSLQGDLRKAESAFQKSMGSMADATGITTVALGNLAAQGVAALGTAIAGAISDVIALGGTLGDMSAKTGVSMSALQEWGFAAEQTGSSLDTVATASSKLGVNLVEGSKGTTQALNELGLSQKDLLAMNPEQRFEAVAEAIGKIPDPANRAALETALLGKSGVELDPAIQNFGELTEQAQKLGIVIGDETLAAADEFGDQMDILKTQGMAMVAEFLKPFLPIIADMAKQLTALAREVFPVIRDAVMGFVTWLFELDLKWLKFIQSIRQSATDIPILGRMMGLTATSAKALDDEIARVEGDLVKLKSASTDAGAAGKKAADVHAAATARLGDAEDKAAEAAKKLAEAEKKRLDALTGADAVAATKQMIADIEKIGGVSKMSAEAAAHAQTVLLAGIAVLGKDAPTAWREIALATAQATEKVKDHTAALQAAMSVMATAPAGLEIPDFLPTTRGIAEIADIMKTPMPKGVTFLPPADFKQWETYGAQVSQSIIGAVQGGGSIWGAAGATVGGIAGKELGGTLAKKAATAIGGQFGKLAGGALGAVVPVLGSIGGELLGKAFGKLFGPSEHSKVNDMRDSFIDAAGGLDALRAKAFDAGMGLETLLKAKKVKDFESAVAGLEGAFAKSAASAAHLVTSMAQASAGGTVLGTDAVKQLSKLKAGTDEGAKAFEFFASQTQVAATGATTFLQNASVTSQRSADALTSSLGAIYEDFRLQGMGPAQAMAALSPAISALNEQLTAAGFSGNAAFTQLAAQASLTTDEVAGPLYTAIGGLGSLMTGLSNTGRMNQEVFGGLTSQITDTWQELEKMGKGGAAGLANIQPELQTVWELQKDYNYEVDESTQHLLDMAEESGLVGESFRSDQEKMTKAIETLVTRMGDLVKVLEHALPNAAATGAQGVENELAGITPPTIHVPVVFDYEDGGPGGGGTGGSSGPLTRAAPASLRGSAVTQVSVNIDGERIAEASTRYTGRVLAPYGAGV